MTLRHDDPMAPVTVAMIYRTDATHAHASDEPELAKPWRDANGFYHCEGKVARVGVMAYPQPSGKVVHELVTPEILFDEASMASLVGLPVTDRHPATGMVVPENAHATQLGAVSGPPRRAGRYLVAPLTITDAGLIAKVESGGQIDLSPGYPSMVTMRPGVWTHPEYAPTGEHYDSAQGRRLYNHLAVVPKGRCSGPCGSGDACSCSIRTDSQGAPPMAVAPKVFQLRTDGATATVPIEQLKAIVMAMDPKKAVTFLLGLVSSDGGEPMDVPKADVPALDAKPPGEDKPPMTDEEKKAYMANQSRTDELIATLKTERVKDQARIDGLTDRLAALTAGQAAQPGAVRARLDLERKAARVLGERYDASQQTDDQLRVTVLSALVPSRKEMFATAAPEYLAVRFDEAVADHAAAAAPRQPLQPVVHNDSAPLVPGDMVEARRRMIANLDRKAVKAAR